MNYPNEPILWINKNEQNEKKKSNETEFCTTREGEREKEIKI